MTVGQDKPMSARAYCDFGLHSSDTSRVRQITANTNATDHKVIVPFAVIHLPHGTVRPLFGKPCAMVNRGDSRMRLCQPTGIARDTWHIRPQVACVREFCCFLCSYFEVRPAQRPRGHGRAKRVKKGIKVVTDVMQARAVCRLPRQCFPGLRFDCGTQSDVANQRR